MSVAAPFAIVAASAAGPDTAKKKPRRIAPGFKSGIAQEGKPERWTAWATVGRNATPGTSTGLNAQLSCQFPAAGKFLQAEIAAAFTSAPTWGAKRLKLASKRRASSFAMRS